MSVGNKGRNDSGFALLLVIISLAVLSLIVATIYDASRRTAASSENRVEALQLRAAMDGTFATVARDLTQTNGYPSQISAHRLTVMFPSSRVTASLRAESAKIDLNGASPELLVAFLVRSGVNSQKAAMIADEIADWRDADDDVHPAGAEASDYLAAGKGYTPPNRPIETVSELALLLKGSNNLVRCVAPDVTVFARSGIPDQVAASERVRDAARMAGLPQTPTASVLSGTSVAGDIVAIGQIYELRLSAVSLNGGITITRQMAVRVTGDPAKPLWILDEPAEFADLRDAKEACARLNKEEDRS